MIVVANSGQTLSTATNNAITITAAQAGNILVVFASQIASVLASSGSDNISGTTGWSTNATNATSGVANVNSTFMMMKTAVGGETTLTVTGGVGATVEGLSYFELANASTTVEAIVGTSNTSTTLTTLTSAALTTANVGDMILACSGLSGASGAIMAWTGTGPMTNITVAASRTVGGSYRPGTSLSAVTFTANWTQARAAALLVVAFQPTVVTAVPTSTLMMMGV